MSIWDQDSVTKKVKRINLNESLLIVAVVSGEYISKTTF